MLDVKEQRTATWKPLALFVKDVYAPALHIAFAAAWFLALDGAFALLSPERIWHLAYLPVGIVVYFLVLFYLRVVDEWKDLDYDRIYNPDRPLVSGIVTMNHVYGFLAGSAALTLALQLVFPPFAGGSQAPLAILAADLAYGLLLVALERFAPVVRNQMMLNLLVTYPVNVALSFYAYSARLGRTGSGADARGLLIILAFALAFLHYEFARKIAWRARPGKRLYSATLGPFLALSLSIIFATGAIAIAAALLVEQTPWGLLPLIAIVPVVIGILRFRKARSESSRALLAPFAILFLTVYYLTILGVALIHTTWSL